MEARAITTQGQEPEITDMQSYIEYLKEVTQENPELQVAFRFHKPLQDTEDDWWVVPYVSDDSELTRDIHFVGEDFMCFIEATGSTPAILCTPYSNIVTINFVSLP
jgi:hypothetical protein